MTNPWGKDVDILKSADMHRLHDEVVKMGIAVNPEYALPGIGSAFALLWKMAARGDRRDSREEFLTDVGILYDKVGSSDIDHLSMQIIGSASLEKLRDVFKRINEANS